MRNFLISSATLIALLSPALAQDAPESTTGLYPKIEKELFVPSGKMRTTASFYGASGDCTPWNLNEIEVRTTKEPTNGKLDIVPGEVVAGFKKDGPLAKCSGKKTRAININYKSADKFIGTDEFELLVMWPNGRASEMHVVVNVK